MEQWVFSKHNRCLPSLFNSIFFPPSPLIARIVDGRSPFLNPRYIYIYSRSTARILSIGLMRPGLQQRGGGGGEGSFSNICSMVYENWKIESPGSPPIFFHLADNWAARAMPPIFEPSDIVWIFIWCPSVDRCAHGLTDFKYGFPSSPSSSSSYLFLCALIDFDSRLHAFIF